MRVALVSLRTSGLSLGASIWTCKNVILRSWKRSIYKQLRSRYHSSVDGYFLPKQVEYQHSEYLKDFCWI